MSGFMPLRRSGFMPRDALVRPEQEIWRRSTFSFQCPKYISDNEKQQHHQCGDGYRCREQWPLQLLLVHVNKFDAEDGLIAAV